MTTYTANPQVFDAVPHCFHDIILNEMSWFCEPKNKAKNEEKIKINGFILTVDVSDSSKDPCKDLKHLIVAWNYWQNISFPVCSWSYVIIKLNLERVLYLPNNIP